MSFERAWSLVELVFSPLLLAGAFAAGFGWRPGIYIAVAALGGLVTGRVLVAVAAYRRTMRRPWPRVQALADDDDEW